MFQDDCREYRHCRPRAPVACRGLLVLQVVLFATLCKIAFIPALCRALQAH
jgi:hypothetical protein